MDGIGVCKVDHELFGRHRMSEYVGHEIVASDAEYVHGTL